MKWSKLFGWTEKVITGLDTRGGHFSGTEVYYYDKNGKRKHPHYQLDEIYEDVLDLWQQLQDAKAEIKRLEEYEYMYKSCSK